MAWSSSEVFMALITDALNNTAALDGNGGSFKIALYDNDITPDQTVASANTAYNAGVWASTGNEVSDGTNWDAGGEPLVSPTSSFTSTTYTFDAVDTSQGGASCTLANVYGGLIYQDDLTTPVADQGWCYLYFVGVQSVTGGTFTVSYHSNGILTVTG